MMQRHCIMNKEEIPQTIQFEMIYRDVLHILHNNNNINNIIIFILLHVLHDLQMS